MANNIVSFGLKNVKYSKITITDGVLSYGSIKELKGAQELSTEITGGSTNVYGDDFTLANFNAYVGNTITLKMTEIPDEFKTDILGYTLDDNNNLVEVASNSVSPFALGYELAGDQKKRRVWFMFCTASPVGESTKSNTDSIEANSTTLNITSYALTKGDYEYIKVVAAEGDANYNTFFDAVPEVEFVYDKVMSWNPTNGQNDGSFVVADGSPTSVSGYTCEEKSYSKAVKITSSLGFKVTIPENAQSAKLEIVGYANSTSNTATVTYSINGSTYTTPNALNTKDIKEMNKIEIPSVKSGDVVYLSKGSAEAGLCEIILTLHYE